LKKAVLSLIRLLGYELRARNARDTLPGALRHAWAAGFAPATVIDIGAGRGDFSLACHRVFPGARYLLVEPLDEFVPAIEEALRFMPNSRHVKAAAAAEAGDAVINVLPDLFGSSLYLEDEDTDVNGAPRAVATVTLDGLTGEGGLEAPYLLKLDVQGAELDVLAGAGNTLAGAGVVILEVSFLGFFEGGPQFFDVLTYMKDRGFAVYDLFGISHRPLDGALAQADVVFVKEDGSLRSHHRYATGAQRQAQTQRMLNSLGKRQG
jgi:FkbM family methyltransferase